MPIGITLVIVFLLMVALSVPISIGMGLATVTGLLLGSYDMSTLPLLIEKGTNNYILIAIPYFVLAANIMNSADITRRIFDFADAAIGWIKGGLAQVNVIASMIFAGISGTSSGDTAGLGLVELKAMKEKGYDLGWATSITLASSIVGPIIPPSAPFIVVALFSEVSVAKLFVAGIIPGVIVCLVLMLANFLIAISGKVKCPKPEHFKLFRLWETFRRGFLALMAPVVLLWGIMSGAVTATETGIIAVCYSLFVGIVYKAITKKRLFEAFAATVRTTSVIMFLIGMGYGMGYLLTLERVPQLLTESLLNLTHNKYLLLIIINIGLLIMGMFIDGSTIRIITIPLLLPTIDMLGISRIHFGVFHTLNLLIGYCTPPVGVGLIIMASITKMKFVDIVRSFLPFYGVLLLLLVVIIFFPIITTWLPSVVFGNS